MKAKKGVVYQRKKKFNQPFPWSKLIYIAVLFFLLLELPPQNVYSFRSFTENFTPKVDLQLPTPAPLPENITLSQPPELSANGVMIVDLPSGMTLFEKNPDEKLLPASTTKIMTALVTLGEYQLSDIVRVRTVISEGQVMGLVPGEMITVENLLYGILVHSANDAAYALAEHFPSGVEGFVAKMNQKAADLSLTNTHFTNPIGFDDEAHYTTAEDLARLSRVALQHPVITKIAAVPQITVSDSQYIYFHPLKNVNELVGKIPGVGGLKTGWTLHAGQSVVTTVQRNSHQVLFVILKSNDRFGETEQLIEWVFTNFRWRNLSPSPY